MTIPDISREAVEGRPAVLDGVVNRALIEGLVAALDEANAERDKMRAELAEILAENDAVRFQLNNAVRFPLNNASVSLDAADAP